MNFSGRRCLLALGFWMGWGLGLPFSATAAPLTLDQALALADKAPSVQGIRAAAITRGTEDRKLPALSTNPQLTVQAGYRVLPDALRGFELQASLQQPFYLGNLGAARRHAAQAERDALQQEVRSYSLAQRLQTARFYLLLAGVRGALTEAQSEVALAGELAKKVAGAAAAALLLRVDAAEARTYEEEAHLQATTLEGEVAELQVQLALSIGRPAEQEIVLQPLGELINQPPRIPSPSQMPELLQKADRLPKVLLRRLLAQAEKARLKEQEAGRSTQMQLGAVLIREADGSLITQGLVGLTPPLFERGQRDLAISRGIEARLVSEVKVELEGARAELVQSFHEVEHTEAVLVHLRDHLVPATKDTVRLREAAYKAGQGTILELLLARRMALSIRGRLKRAEAAHLLARVHLALLWREMEVGS